jgi:hypothetical protein
VAEKVAAPRTADYFRERASRANVPAVIALLDRLATDEAPRAGDELAPVKSHRRRQNAGG